MIENKKNNYIANLIQKIKYNKKIQIIIIFVLTVIIVLTALFGFKSESVKTSTTQGTDEINEYILNLEKKLSSTLSKVNGAGEVSVIITVESGKETVLAMKTTTTKDTSSGTEIEESPIIINGKPVVIKELYPKITGVLIVAKGANNIGVMTKLQQATVSLLDIELNQIEILTMK